VHALGKDRVFGIFMPERASSDESLELGQLLAKKLGIATETMNLAPSLEALGCYRAQQEAIKAVFPDATLEWKFKITLPSILDSDRLNFYQLTVQAPGGKPVTQRLPLEPYLKLVAATNFKQRVRKMVEYFHADRLNYAVGGTPNRLEYDQGFFVKQGDGAADVKPIAHLYKTQVYAIAAELGVPKEILSRPPTTDTYSLAQGQDEFFFAIAHAEMDLALWAHDHKVPAAEVAPVLKLTAEQVERVYRDIESKRRFAHYLHSPPLLIRPVEH
jgi:NAD+ synthase